jgi:serine/threonine-protein kinase RsbW
MPEHAPLPIPPAWPPVWLPTAATSALAAARHAGLAAAASRRWPEAAAPCGWPVAPVVTTRLPGRRAALRPTVTLVRSRAFTECPGTQIAARARAMAATSAEVLVASTHSVSPPVADEPAPAAALPLADHRGPGRYCVGTFSGQREQVGQARAFLAAFLGGWARTDDAVLLMGELGANAVVHTGSGAPGGLFTVRASLAGAWLRAEVEDQGSTWNGRLEDAECPHGLFLLRQLSNRCGARRTRGGWVTWFVLGDWPSG